MNRADWDQDYKDLDDAWTAEPETIIIDEVKGLKPGRVHLELGICSMIFGHIEEPSTRIYHMSLVGFENYPTPFYI